MLTLLLQINSQVTSNLRLSHLSVHSRPYFTEIRTNTTVLICIFEIVRYGHISILEQNPSSGLITYS